MSLRSRPCPMYAVLLAVLLAATVACGGQEPGETPSTEAAPTQEATAPAPATETAAPDPCTLLTAQDIETATGITPGAGAPVANACSWGAADGSTPRLVTLTVLHGDLTRENWLAGGGSADDIVEGVGEFAVRVGSQLQVYQDDWLVGVAVRAADRPEAAKELARTVLGKLTG